MEGVEELYSHLNEIVFSMLELYVSRNKPQWRFSIRDEC
jgi:hypothetical protein